MHTPKKGKNQFTGSQPGPITKFSIDTRKVVSESKEPRFARGVTFNQLKIGMGTKLKNGESKKECKQQRDKVTAAYRENTR